MAERVMPTAATSTSTGSIGGNDSLSTQQSGQYVPQDFSRKSLKTRRLFVKCAAVFLIALEAVAVLVTVVDMLRAQKTGLQKGSPYYAVFKLMDELEEKKDNPAVVALLLKEALGKNSVINSLHLQAKNATVKNVVDNLKLWRAAKQSQADIAKWISGVNEIAGLLACCVCNLFLFYSIHTNKPQFMIPWLVIYLIGIISLYLGSVMLFLSGQSWSKVLFPLGMGLLFTVLWDQVKTVFIQQRAAMSHRYEEVELAAV